ncbi:MAG: efflux RND transporter periplasmic adaptor subunit [Gammaproteobacteria bacterium]|nr:MAG: efflux RND transporter periplasmic adaptor subunit [Gammaproteobacteria bacterium]
MKTNINNIISIVVVLVVIIGAGLFYWNPMQGGDAETMGSEKSQELSTLKLDPQEFVTVGNYRIRTVMDPVTPETGVHTLSIWIRDQNDQLVGPIQGRAVVQFEQDSNEIPINIPIELKSTQPGQLQGTVTLEQVGEWALAIDIETESLGHGDLILGFKTGEPGLTQIVSTPSGISHYTCAMHPSVKSATPGACPICSMNLVAVTHDDVTSKTITIDNRRRQMIGIETGKAIHGDMRKEIRAVGSVTYDERRLSNVTLKFDAWVGELSADYVGAQVKKGEMLFTVYSPELLAAQQEYLETLKRLARRGSDDSLLIAARQRLKLWDMSSWEIKALEKRDRPREYIPIYASSSGTIVEKNVEEGGAIKMGETLFRIADLSQVWVEAEVYEADLELIQEGMAATITLPYLPSKTIEATVDYIYPYLEGDSRTARIRLNLDNENGALKPDMYAEVKLVAEFGHRLVVPEEAVMIAGDSRVVFVDLGEGKLKPVKVKTGRRVNNVIEIVDGLELGDIVVTSGNFLIASETKLKAGIDQW